MTNFLLNMDTNEVACGIMMNKQGKILVGLRKEGYPGAGYWEFPGGKKKMNESIQDCLAREWVEELNLRIRIYKEFYSYKCEKYYCRFFVGEIVDEENLEVKEHEEVEFLNINDIFKKKLYEGDFEMLKSIKNELNI